MSRVCILCVTLLTCAALLLTVVVLEHIQELKAQLASLEQTTARLRSQLHSTQLQHGSEHVQWQESVDALLDGHRHWNWNLLVRDLLQPFGYVNEQMLEGAVRACFDNGTMYCTRLQVSQGRLYVTDYRAIFFDRHYAPSRVMPLLDLLRRHPDLPDVDLVVAAVDEPRIKTLVHRKWWTRTCKRWPGEGGLGGGGKRGELPPPLFSSTINRAHLDLPWLDFSFFMPRRDHKLRTPPWSVLHPKMVRESASVRWEDKIELAMHTGNTMSPFRQKVVAAAKKRPDTMLVNELFIGDHNKIKKTCHELGLERKGGYQAHKCYMTFTEQCSYKYLLNSASIGYANKFKYLLLCGSVVIYVQDGMSHKEFYEHGLLPGVHYVSVPTANDVPAMVEMLRRNDSYARAVAQAGRARMSALDSAEASKFLAELLTGYSKLQTFKVRPHPGSARIDCEDDLWRHYARETWFLGKYLMRDNATCIHPIRPSASLGPPGWGGAYNGSKVRCVASHDLLPHAQPDACKKYTRWLGGTSFAPWDAFPSAHPEDRTRWRDI